MSDDESGAEWLARENKRLADRVRELESQNRKLRADAVVIEGQKSKLAADLERSGTAYYSLLTDLREALERAEGRTENY